MVLIDNGKSILTHQGKGTIPIHNSKFMLSCKNVEHYILSLNYELYSKLSQRYIPYDLMIFFPHRHLTVWELLILDINLLAFPTCALIPTTLKPAWRLLIVYMLKGITLVYTLIKKR